MPLKNHFNSIFYFHHHQLQIACLLRIEIWGLHESSHRREPFNGIIQRHYCLMWGLQCYRGTGVSPSICWFSWMLYCTTCTFQFAVPMGYPAADTLQELLLWQLQNKSFYLWQLICMWITSALTPENRGFSTAHFDLMRWFPFSNLSTWICWIG